MKQTIVAILVSMSLSTAAWAQRGKMTSQTAPPAYTPSYLSNSDNEITALLGLTSGAIHLGVDYVHSMNSTFGAGGYFFLQTSKDKNNVPIVNQLMSFGGLMKINLLDANGIKAYVAPGAGITIVKDGSINASGTKSDETVIGPVWKMGVSYKAGTNFNIGLESTMLANYFNDNLTGVTQTFYSVAVGFGF